jgi:hypothetical protein
MINVSFPDGSKREYPDGSTPLSIAESISKSLAKRSVIAKVNGELRDIRLQVSYRLEFNGVLICRYHADFVYEERTKGAWAEVVEDVKGFKTPAYKLKKKLMRACHNIEIRET